MERVEQFVLMTSFYGPDADHYDGLLRDGILVPQNSEVLLLAAIGLVEPETAVRAPELIKGRWWDKIDDRIRYSRVVLRVYPVLNLLSIAFQASLGVPPINVSGVAVDPNP